jgi:hypothetical protein
VAPDGDCVGSPKISRDEGPPKPFLRESLFAIWILKRDNNWLTEFCIRGRQTIKSSQLIRYRGRQTTSCSSSAGNRVKGKFTATCLPPPTRPQRTDVGTPDAGGAFGARKGGSFGRRFCFVLSPEVVHQRSLIFSDFQRLQIGLLGDESWKTGTTRSWARLENHGYEYPKKG